jgi:ribosomal-protein-alanine N-acetyltransferase
MAGDFPIRLAAEADLPAIVGIEHAVFSDPWSLEAFRRSLAGIVTVAVSGETVAGYLVAHHTSDFGEILNVAVHPDHRRHGIGWALVEDVLWRLASDSVGLVFLEVRESNTAAQRLYGRMGFEAVGRRSAYYREPKEDAVVMRISNIQPPTIRG